MIILKKTKYLAHRGLCIIFVIVKTKIMKRILIAFILAVAVSSQMPMRASSLPPVEDTASTAASVRVDGCAVYIAAAPGIKVDIYSITGSRIKATTTDRNGTACVELPQGCYIVRCSDMSKKILVGS